MQSLPRFRFSLATLFLLVTIVALALGTYYSWQGTSRREELAAIFGGETGLVLLTNPDKVEVYRLGPPAHNMMFPVKVDDCPIKDGPFAVSTTDTLRLQQSLGNWSSYGWGYAKSCLPRYGVRIDFTRGNDQLQVLFCFECELLGCWINDKMVGGEDFDPINAELVQIVKSIFPNDLVIQALKP